MIKDGNNLYVYIGDDDSLDITVTDLIPNMEYTSYFDVDMENFKLKDVTATTDAKGTLNCTFEFPHEETEKYKNGSFPYAIMVCCAGKKHTIAPHPLRPGYFKVLKKAVEEI